MMTAQGGGGGSIRDIYTALKSIINYMARPIWLDSSNGRVRADVATCTTVTGVTSLSQVALHDARGTLLAGVDRASWALNVRGRIT
jgi:hypothetical protein